VVSFPGAVILVANLPILEAVTLGDVPVADPVSGLGGGARTVIDRDEDLCGGGAGDVGELVERRGPLPGVAAGGVGLPMIFVGQRPARETQSLVSHLGQERDGCSAVENGVPNGGVHAELARVD